MTENPYGVPSVSETAKASPAKPMPWQFTCLSFFLSVLLFPLPIFSLAGVTVMSPGRVFMTGVWLGHPLLGLAQSFAVSPGSYGQAFNIAIFLWPLEWMLYGFLLDYGGRRSQVVSSIAVILLVVMGLALNALAAFLAVHYFLLLPYIVIISGIGIALIYIGRTRPKPAIKTKRRKFRPTRNAASPVRS
jgi:hypothetical protein